MYIDKIYTKLYSERNWNGLDQLVNEIKSFARKDYEGLGWLGKKIQKNKRDDDAARLKWYKNNGYNVEALADFINDNSDKRRDFLKEITPKSIGKNIFEGGKSVIANALEVPGGIAAVTDHLARKLRGKDRSYKVPYDRLTDDLNNL